MSTDRSVIATLIFGGNRTSLRVEAWDAAGICPDLIDVAVTDARGRFTMALDVDYLATLLPQKAPQIAFRIFQKGKPLSLAVPVVWIVSQQETELQIPVKPAGGSDLKLVPAQSVVRGTVRNGDGSPAVRRTVHAVDRTLTAKGFVDKPLGTATTAADGQYEIHYLLRGAQAIKPNLIVRVQAAAPPVDAPIPITAATESPLIANAPTAATVDLSLGGIAAALPSEHSTLTTPLQALVSRAKIDIADLTADHLAFAAATTGLQADAVQTIAQAAQISRDANGAIDPEIAYGLLRTGHDGDFAALAATPLDVQRPRLEAAVDANLIAATREPQLDAIVTALQTAVVSRALPTTGVTSVSAALGNSLSSGDVQSAFVSRWVARTGSVQDFWDGVRADSTLGPAAADLELTLRLDMLFGGYQPALADLRAQRQNGGVTSLRDLARWQDTDWQPFIERVGAPHATAGDTPAAKQAAFAQTLQSSVRAWFPTEYLRGRAAIPAPPLATNFVSILAAGNPALDLTRPLPDAVDWGSIAAGDRAAARAQWSAFQREARTFRSTSARTLLASISGAGGTNAIRAAANGILIASADLDLEHTTVDRYLAAHASALETIAPSIRPPVVSYLKSVQRVLRIVGTPEAVEPLMADGLDCALRIVRVPRNEFVDRYATLLGGERQAHAAFSNAFRTATTAQVALTTTAQSIAGASPWAVRGGSTTVFPVPAYGSVLDALKKAAGADGTATWPALFDGQAWCDCDDCQSIYGPAAYFVDLLHMLDPDGSDQPPADQLFARRPDLPNLLLTCDNTNTPLPYIDVVNEVLELQVAAKNGYVDPNSGLPYATSTSYDSTGLSAAELRAVPQNLVDEVYEDALRNDVYPFTLPFRRSLAVMRTYLDQLGVSYADLLASFGPQSGADGLTADERLAAETLGLTARQFALIAGMASTPPVTLPECYGYGASDAQWQDALTVVPELLRRAGISYDDLYALTGTYFLNHGGAVTLDPPVQCQIGDTKLHAAADTWDRLHRFVRLWRATGWSIADLDRALFAVGAQTDRSVVLDRDSLRRVALVKRTIDTLGQPLAATLALWSDLDTWGSDALYLALFQNRAVARLDDASAFALAGDPSAMPPEGVWPLATTTGVMSAHAATIQAALRITAGDLDAIRTHALDAGALVALSASGDPMVDVHNLTVVYRYTVLAKGLGVRISDLITLLELTGANPFTPNDPDATLALVDQIATVRASGCSIATLAYLFRCDATPGQGPAPADSVMFDALDKISAALRDARQDTAIADDPDGTLLSARLAQFQPSDVVAAIVDALNPAGGQTLGARRQTIDDGLRPLLGDAVAAADAAVFGTPDPDPSDSVGLSSRQAANRAVILALVSDALRTSLSQSAVISVVAGTLGLTDSMTRRLLVDLLPGDSGTALDMLLEMAGGGLNSQPFDAPGYASPEPPTTSDSLAVQTTADSPLRGMKWNGFLRPLGTGDHTFVLRTDGACSIAIGGQAASFAVQLDGTQPLLIDHTTTAGLTADQLVPLEVAYDSGTAAGRFALQWKLATANTAAPIDSEHLFPTLSSLASADHGPGFVWKRAHKASLLILGLGLTEDEVAYAEADDLAFAGLRLRDLPMEPPPDPDVHAAMARWLELAAFVAVRASLPTTDSTLVDVLQAATPPATPDPLTWWTSQLCAATGWDPATVQPLLSPVANWTGSGTTIVALLLAGVDGPVSGSLQLGPRLAALQRALDLIKRVGVAGDSTQGARPTLRAWTSSEPDAAAAREVVKAVRARYPDDTQWYQVAQNRNDTLRQLQRDALVAHLLPSLTVPGAATTDANALYEQFLIDVEMCACGQTSRVLQGISTVQLFIQRILLGLEAPISPNRIDPDRWEWNQQYRIWQANREIFLYPENWIDPELRTDKTPFFAELQSRLSQGALDDDTIESAFETYLLELDQVSRLKVCALHWQREGSASDADSELSDDKSIDTLHVVARTPGATAAYFYRTLLGTAVGGGGTEWTPWEKIDLDIQGDGDTGDVHMLLTTFDRRLYMFWALFTEVPEPNQPGADLGDSPAPPLTHWEIRLAWSTYRNGAWSGKQVTSDVIRSNRFITDKDLKSYASALDDMKAAIAQAKSRYQKAIADEETAAAQAWSQITELGNQFRSLVSENLHDDGEPSDAMTVASMALYLVGFMSTDLETFEKWVQAARLTVSQFLDDIFKFVNDLPEGFLTIGQDDLDAAYQDVLDLRKKRDAREDDLDAATKALKNFKQGKTALAIPDLTTRANHTFWLSTADGGVAIDVLRHDDRHNPKKLGTFTLSDDGRSVSLTATSGVRVDLTRQTPRHSAPDVNAFQVDTTKHKGLDFEGLPNLLLRAREAEVVDEHWYGRPVTGDHLRPFAVTRGSAVEIGLPFGAASVDEPPETRVFGQGISIVETPSPIASNLQSAVPAGVETLRSQKSFGLEQVAANPGPTAAPPPYCFEPLHHAFVRTFIKRLERDGVDGLLTVHAQNPAGSDAGEHGAHFDDTFKPSATLVAYPYSPHDVDFRPQGPYAPYNWELFFHVPFLIARRLMQDAQYDEARRWLHYIFDPTTGSSDDASTTRFWKLQPFRDNTDTLDASQLMSALATGQPADLVASVNAQIDQWRRYPAEPHRIARLRLSAYQKAIVFTYLDNLIAWADSLFRQDTIETINQATQLYVFASDLLGARPQHVPQDQGPQAFTYGQLRGHLDGMSDMVAEVEGLLAPLPAASAMSAPDPAAWSLLGISHLPVVWPSGSDEVTAVPLTFCVPSNTKLQTYFDTIDDRLFKIRHCMNIEGVVQQLPLFQPPIDPALLVRAAAMGLDIGSILSDLAAPLPLHRFTVVLQRALELCGELKALGSLLLSALEKQDAESLSQLRATQETALQKAVMTVKTQQVKEAEINTAALQRARDLTQAKYEYYASRQFTNSWETNQLNQMGDAELLQAVGGAMIAASGSFYGIPTFSIGPTGMGVHAAADMGGPNIGETIKAMGQAITLAGQQQKDAAQASGILGGHHRRQDEWNFQKDLATKELAQIDQQIAAADIRIAIANLDVANQQLQIDNATKIEDTLRTKYTNTELYSWMVTQISTTYYQAYKLAYDLAKRAERCYRFELGIESSSRFVQFGYWDSLKKGLLAGEQLALDLKRMDASYLQLDRREYEITRHISLVLQDPQAFVDLRTQGWCEIDLPEELFDADYPGHYFRRIRSVSLTLPCVAGPYTPINCTLTLLASHVRMSSSAAGKYPEQDAPNDGRFSHSYGAIQSVATSHGQSDAGLFEVNFRDERYLPFEGAGAISRWRLDLPRDANAFDVDTLSDVVIKLSYTARDGGRPLADAARRSLRERWAGGSTDDGATPMTALARLFRVRYEFSDAWVQFRNALSAGDATLTLPIAGDRFPFLFRGAPITVIGVRLVATLTGPVAQAPVTLTVTPPSAQPTDLTLSPTASDATVFASDVFGTSTPVDATTGTTWRIAAKSGFPIASVRDLMLVMTYTVVVPAYKT